MLVISKRTQGGRRPLTLALLFAMLGAALIAVPAAAATPPTSDYGNTADCRYKAPGNGPAFDFRLKNIVVTPPVLYGTKATPQTVGWRFIVTRSMNQESGPWTETYRSPIQKRTATTTTAADFSTMSVGVTVPNVENVGWVHYHVTLKLLRYRSDGSLKSKATYLMPYYKWTENGQEGYWDAVCPSGYYNGP
jgi:hypothetical protein